MQKIKNFIAKNKVELLVIVILLIISGIAHGCNMFHFPYYENDEGTYMARAWSLMTRGEFAPYTFWYDHVPGASFFIALWVMLTRGFFTFGASVNSGRVLMLLLHLGSSYFLFGIAKKLSRGMIAGIIAVLIFSLSPLGLYFQRRVLLDNIMVFWMLFSWWLLLRDSLTLKHIYLSALAFGFAVLCKEPALFFIPAYLYLIYIRTSSSHRRFSLMHWLAISGSIISLYIIYAFVKNELFPTGFLGDTREHVSLLETLKYQSTRGSGLTFWHPNSEFNTTLKTWLAKDSYTVMLGLGMAILSALASIKVKYLRTPLFMFITYLLFLIRGQVVLDFYVIPLMAFLSLISGLMLDILIKRVSFNRCSLYAVFFVVVTASIGYSLFSNQVLGQYTKDESTPQAQTIEWIKENLHPNSLIVIDMSLYIDLHNARYPGDRVYPNAEWAWKVEKDPEVFAAKLDNNWKNVDYVALSHEMLRQMQFFEYDIMRDVMQHTYLVADWSDQSTAYIDVEKSISTNGDWMKMYKVKTKEEIMLDELWNFYKSHFIISYGQVVDPSSGNTTSEGQSYALLRAVWKNDRSTFDGVWAWTKDHLQHRRDDKLFSWLWKKDGEEYVLGDPSSAADADQDIALALLFAYRQWGEDAYLSAAKEIINDIWRQEVVQIKDRYYLTLGAGPYYSGGYLVNPSYFSPAHYRIFQEIDPAHPWNQLLQDSYWFLDQLSTASIAGYDNNILPPNWIFVEEETGNLISAEKQIADPTVYGFDAMRIPWRVALDYQWHQSQEAFNYLTKLDFFLKEWQTKYTVSAVYNLDGTKGVQYESLSQYGNLLALFSVLDKTAANDIYQQKILPAFNSGEHEAYWGSKDSYYDQNWVWFGTAYYFEETKNLWSLE